MARFTKYDMQAEMLRLFASTLDGVALRYERGGAHFNDEIKERRHKIWSGLYEVADKLRSIAYILED